MTATTPTTSSPAPDEATTPARGVNRRTALTTGGVLAAGTALLAACGGSEGGGETDAGAAPRSSTTSDLPTTPATSETPSEPADTATAGGGAPIVQLADVPVGGSVAATLDDKAIIVSQPTAGTVVAFDAACTHKGCPVKPAGAQLNCPCHNSNFDVATGEPLSGPAQTALAKVAVKVEGGAVVAGA
ncbi:MAG TPA: Rieske (2Fe-2S) protein [Actinomycetales bacterium]|jgi:nitrite reductase/ring-hydroxylating ferredoxin subunit